ncbi:hypothetical protein SCAR479_00040 [Seiridium cardinale]|uniref:Uncharacterized protein n=1 Tax=Seiridium cardinale TaxID=138064 RepID=A0ABR2Y8S8_9PEZI
MVSIRPSARGRCPAERISVPFDWARLWTTVQKRCPECLSLAATSTRATGDFVDAR